MSNQPNILRWSHGHAVLMLALTVSSFLSERLEWLVIGAGISFGYYLWSGRYLLSAFKLGVGRANWVTILRISIISYLLLFYAEITPSGLAIILVLTLCLDGLDGYLARRFNEAGEFGQNFDLEADSFAICGLCLMVCQLRDLNWLLIGAGSLRYSYILLVRFTVTTPSIEPKRKYASVIAVTFYILLVVNILWNAIWLTWILYIGVVLLAISFLRSYIFQLKG